jgi:hypothetical protein
MARVAMVTQRANLNKGPGTQARGGCQLNCNLLSVSIPDQFTLIVSYLIHFLRIHRFNENG